MNKLTTEDFIEKSKSIHGDKYDYRNTVYTLSNKKVSIECMNHGPFLQTANDHLQGKGCKKCTGKGRTTDEAITLLKEKHGDKYDYSKLIYKNTKSKLEIICKKHGIFLQNFTNHHGGQGCPKCKSYKKIKTLKVFQEQAVKIHNNKYEYLDYIRDDLKIKIRCPNHGVFKQMASNHLQGHGCSKCGTTIISKPEIEVADFVKSLNLEILTSKRDIINPLELDIYIPKLNMAIEFNGNYWHYNHSNPNCKPKGYHAQKSNLCREKGIKLLHIREDLWKKDTEKMKKVIKRFLKT